MLLLRRMGEEIKGLRPALFSKNVIKLLDELRAFRHVFRHAYPSELDSEKIKIVLDKAMELRQVYKQEVQNFLEKLKDR